MHPFNIFTAKCMDLTLLSSIHKCGRVGHIEDIAVAKDQQGKKLGLYIIQALDFIGEKVGCYKVCPCSPFAFFFPSICYGA